MFTRLLEITKRQTLVQLLIQCTKTLNRFHMNTISKNSLLLCITYFCVCKFCFDFLGKLQWIHEIWNLHHGVVCQLIENLLVANRSKLNARDHNPSVVFALQIKSGTRVWVGLKRKYLHKNTYFNTNCNGEMTDAISTCLRTLERLDQE